MKPSPTTDLAPAAPSPVAAPAVGDARVRAPRVVLALAAALLTLVAGLFAGGVAVLAVGGHLRPWLLLPALVVGTGVGVGVGGGATDVRTLARAGGRLGAALIAILGLALAVGAASYDVSWDGQVYHQQAVLALAEGWNPLWDAPLSVNARPDNLWIDHYPKAAWIAQAILYRATGSLEASKGLQLLPLLAAGLLVFAALRARGAGARAAAACAALLAANPVAIAQSASFYCDGLGASLMTCWLALFSCWLLGPTRWLLVAQAAIVTVLINLKFTGLVYAGGICAGLTVVVWMRRRALLREYLLFSGAAVAVATLALGFDPYVLNLVRRGHPFFPLMGAGAVDIITNQLTPAFHSHSRPVRFLIGLLARADAHNVAPALKWPFFVFADELRQLGYADLRIGGFGPLFAGGLVVALALVLARTCLRIQVPAGAWALGAAVAGVSFLNPALWWARYVPQLWLLPAGALALAVASPALSRAGRWVALLLAALLSTDTALVAGAATVAEWRATCAVSEQLEQLRRSGGVIDVRWDGFEAVRARLAERQIPFREVDVLACATPQALRSSRALICSPTRVAREVGR